MVNVRRINTGTPGNMSGPKILELIAQLFEEKKNSVFYGRSFKRIHKICSSAQIEDQYKTVTYLRDEEDFMVCSENQNRNDAQNLRYSPNIYRATNPNCRTKGR